MKTDAVECSLCANWIHRVCAKISKKTLKDLSTTDDYWYCKNCSVVLPFSQLDDENFVFCNSTYDVETNILPLYERCKNFEFRCFDQYEYKFCDFDQNLDPDSNTFTGFDATCNYYTEEKFTSKVTHKNGLALLHFNCRSIKSSFEAVKKIVVTSNIEFDVITVSETWLNDNDDLTIYALHNFCAVVKNRKDKKGGGVLIFVNEKYDFKPVDRHSKVVNELFESVTVEITIPKGKNVFVSCIYVGNAA